MFPTKTDFQSIDFQPESQAVASEIDFQSESNTGSMPGTEKFLVGVGKGMSDVGTGALQRVLEGGEFLRNILGLESNQENIEKLKQLIEENRSAFQPLADKSTAAKVGEFIGNAAPTLAIPGGVQGGALKRVLSSAAAGGAAGAVQPTIGDESAALNTVIGAGTGGGVSLATSSIGKIINALRGKIPDSKIEEFAKRFGIRTTLGEATDNPITQKAETWLEGVPLIGLKGFREKQNREAEQVAKNFLANYIVDPNATDAMAANRQYASSLFEKLKSTVNGIQNQEILPDETRSAALSLMKRYPDIFKRFQDTKREGIIASILGDTKPVTNISPILNAKGQQIVTTAPKTLTFDEAWTLRDGLGEMIGQARKKLAAGEIDHTTYGEISKLYKAVNDDIDSWAGSIGRGDIRTLINDANGAYKQYVVKYDIIQRALDKAEGLYSAGEMFSPKKFSTALKTIAYKDNGLKKFSPREIDEITGLANIMQVVKRAGQFRENPPTGDRWGLPVLAAATYPFSGTGVAAEIGIVGLARILTGTTMGKNLILAASKVEPDSAAMRNIVNALYNQLPKMGAIGATGD